MAISFYLPNQDVPAALFESSSLTKAEPVEAVSAGCVFWIHGATRRLVTKAHDHASCSVGSLTHGFLPFAQAAEQEDVAAILASGWVSPSQAQAIPTVQQKPEAVVYGPLEAMNPLERVDVVLVRVHGLGLMTLMDSLPNLRIEGKPQCHIIARAKEENVPTASVGCALSRARTGMTAQEMTCALPGKDLARTVKNIEDTVHLNRTMARMAVAKKPTTSRSP